MAFNPIHIFRKYQKLWMAGILLMCMITFVLCTGVGGDLSQQLLKRRSVGKAVAKLNNRDLYYQEMMDLKNQRKAVDLFMKDFCDLIMAKADKIIYPPPDQPKKADDKAYAHKVAVQTAVRAEFKRRRERPSYFGGGFKLDDLVDFKMWLSEADRLGIRLEPEIVQVLLSDYELLHRETVYTRDDFYTVLRQVQNQYFVAKESYIMQGLRDEFRVRIAQLAMMSSQPDRYLNDQLFENAAQVYHQNLAMYSVRAPITPAQLWDFYKAKRAEYTVGIVPIDLKDYRAKVTPGPTDRELDALFRDYANKPYDPTAPTPGFQKPKEVKVAWVTVDPESPSVKGAAKALALLELIPLVYDPTLSRFQNALRYAMIPDAEKLAYQKQFVEDFFRKEQFDNVPLTSAGFLEGVAASQGLESPLALASYIGAMARPDGVPASIESLKSVSFHENAKKFDYARLAQVEANKRIPIYAACSALAATGPMNLISAWSGLSHIPQSVPIDIELPRYREAYEKKLAFSLSQKAMIALRQELDDPRYQGNEVAIKRALAEASVDPKITKEFYNRYSIMKAKELEPLRKAFQQDRYYVNIVDGRAAGSKRYLGDDDFYKLLFEKDESFSAAVGKFNVRPWPPVLQVKPSREKLTRRDVKDIPDPAFDILSDIDRLRIQAPGPDTVTTWDGFKFGKPPFLFWIADETKPETPESLAEVRDRVEEAWRLNKARDQFGFKEAKEIAKVLQDPSRPDAENLVSEQAKKLGRPEIVLRRVASLAQTLAGEGGGPFMYDEYKLPKDLFTYPRPDMVKQVLIFGSPKEPIKIDYEPLDKLNKELFDEYQAGVTKKTNTRLVQVLTNAPRTVFYVAVATTKVAAEPKDFVNSYANPFMDTFLQVAYESYATSAYQDLLNAVRKRTDREVIDAERKAFDSEGTAGGGV